MAVGPPPFEQLHETSDSADIILTSTGAPEPLFRREHGERLRKGRRNRPMFFIDIAVPRNVHPDMNKLDGMFVYDVDDLQSVATDNASERKKEAERAEKIIELEVDRFASRMKSLAVVPTILSLQEYCETIRQAEIDRIRGKLGIDHAGAGSCHRRDDPRHHQQASAYAHYHAQIFH